MVKSLENLWRSTGFVTSLTPIWQNLIMMAIACVLIYLAVAKEFEPNLLLAIGFGMFIINIPGAYNILYGTYGYTFTGIIDGAQKIIEIGGVKLDGLTLSEIIEKVPAISEWIEANVGNFDSLDMVHKVQAIENAVSALAPGYTDISVAHEVVADQGLFFYLYKGVEWVIYPPLIFLGIGAMTDFGPLIANPKSLIMGAAAQLGIFVTFIIAINIGFTGEEGAAIGIIGGADGPTAIYVTVKLASHLLPAISVAAYSYMALIKVIQPPIMKLLTTKKERGIVMEQLRPVSKTEKVIFPIAVTGIVGIILPSAIPLLGMLMLGNLMKESGVVPRLTNTAKNELINIITILLGVIVGSKATADVFLNAKTLLIILIGVFAFAFGTAGGLLIGKLMSKLSKGKINPLIGSAGVSAVPMAARISHMVGQEENPNNYLLMHAMGPNVAGVIGSAVAAGVLLAIFGA
ncbi:MAG: sodium ion-translocating decarboxylase subunit beta [Clostridia bacterium]|nr:sodium ion-translocating decarboxylase subunit beta [Clostridia bacterium]MDE6472433.1 sodium ion-translocating decarboxylase subunit beta [Clostridia bacterium]